MLRIDLIICAFRANMYTPKGKTKKTEDANMKAYNAFRTQVENIKTEKDLKDAHISICSAYSAYRISYEQFMVLRRMMNSRRAEKGFSCGKVFSTQAKD